MRQTDQILVTCDECSEQQITLAHMRPSDDVKRRLREAGWTVIYRRENMPNAREGEWGGARIVTKDICPECREHVMGTDD